MTNLKNTVKVFVIGMIAMLATSNVFASEEVKEEAKLVVKPMANSKKVLFGLAHLNGQKAELQITDKEGKVIYTKSWKDQEEGAHIFNFSQLVEGKYTMSVKIGENMLQETVFINDSNVELGGKGILIPHVNTTQKMVTVSLTSVNVKKLDFKINFYNAEGELVYTETPTVEGIQFAKRYNFEKMDKGTYSYEIAQGVKTYEGNFEIK